MANGTCKKKKKKKKKKKNGLLTMRIINLHLSDSAHGVMVIVAGIGHGDTSSNPGLIAFHIALIPLGKVRIQLFSLQIWVNSRAD